MPVRFLPKFLCSVILGTVALPLNSLSSPHPRHQPQVSKASARDCEWKRVVIPKGLNFTGTADVEHIADLLNKRTAAKRSKNFAEADSSAIKLQSMGVCYDDSTFTWYIKDLVKKGYSGSKVIRGLDASGDVNMERELGDEDLVEPGHARGKKKGAPPIRGGIAKKKNQSPSTTKRAIKAKK